MGMNALLKITRKSHSIRISVEICLIGKDIPCFYISLIGFEKHRKVSLYLNTSRIVLLPFVIGRRIESNYRFESVHFFSCDVLIKTQNFLKVNKKFYFVESFPSPYPSGSIM